MSSWRTCAASLTCLAALLAFAPASQAAGAKSGSIGLVITDWRYAVYETADAKEECTLGLQAGEVAQFKAAPDPQGRLNKFGGTTAVRGPIGENANYNPSVVEDPLPWSEVKTTKGFGVNLDGTQDGHATAKTCKHEKFVSPEAEKIDNQMARVVGCVKGWRKTGFSAEFYANEVVTSPINRHLIEITGVDDEKNDPSVEVTIYKGRDRLVRKADGVTFVPFLSHRIDDRYPQLVFKTHGKIVDGILTTDPIPTARFPLIQIQMVGERVLHDMTLRLDLKAESAEGFIAGYEPLTSWWNMHSKTPSSDVGGYSPAGLYRALHKYADGYPDAKTGECSAISVAYKVTAVRSLIVHPPKGQQHVAQAKAPTRVALAQE